jgi:hypothetical protein
LALIYGLVAAPAAWGVEQVLNATLAQEACFPGTERLTASTIAGLHTVQSAVLVIALLVSASAGWIAMGAWRATRGEHAGGSHTLLSIGEGRSRFMALAGVLTSWGFVVGTLFSVPAVFLVPAC